MWMQTGCFCAGPIYWECVFGRCLNTFGLFQGCLGRFIVGCPCCLWLVWSSRGVCPCYWLFCVLISMQLWELSSLCHMLQHVPPLGLFLMLFLCRFSIWPHHILFCRLLCSTIGIHQCRQTWNHYCFCTHCKGLHGLLPTPPLQTFLDCSLGCRVRSVLVYQGCVRTCTKGVRDCRWLPTYEAVAICYLRMFMCIRQQAWQYT